MGVSTKITPIRTYGGYAMTGNKCKGNRINLQEIFGADRDSFKVLLREVLQEVLEQEMTDALGAEKGERSPGRLGYRSGYYSRGLVTRVGKLGLRIPRDRQGGHYLTRESNPQTPARLASRPTRVRAAIARDVPYKRRTAWR